MAIDSIEFEHDLTALMNIHGIDTLLNVSDATAAVLVIAHLRKLARDVDLPESLKTQN